MMIAIIIIIDDFGSGSNFFNSILVVTMDSVPMECRLFFLRKKQLIIIVDNGTSYSIAYL